MRFNLLVSAPILDKCVGTKRKRFIHIAHVTANYARGGFFWLTNVSPIHFRKHAEEDAEGDNFSDRFKPPGGVTWSKPKWMVWDKEEIESRLGPDLLLQKRLASFAADWFPYNQKRGMGSETQTDKVRLRWCFRGDEKGTVKVDDSMLSLIMLPEGNHFDL